MILQRHSLCIFPLPGQNRTICRISCNSALRSIWNMKKIRTISSDDYDGGNCFPSTFLEASHHMLSSTVYNSYRILCQCSGTEIFLLAAEPFLLHQHRPHYKVHICSGGRKTNQLWLDTRPGWRKAGVVACRHFTKVLWQVEKPRLCRYRISVWRYLSSMCRLFAVLNSDQAISDICNNFSKNNWLQSGRKIQSLLVNELGTVHFNPENLPIVKRQIGLPNDLL